MNTREFEMKNMALSKIGPSFEELNDYEMMEMDGQATAALSPVTAAASASSGWCLASLGISIITYCTFN